MNSDCNSEGLHMRITQRDIQAKIRKEEKKVRTVH